MTSFSLVFPETILTNFDNFEGLQIGPIFYDGVNHEWLVWNTIKLSGYRLFVWWKIPANVLSVLRKSGSLLGGTGGAAVLVQNMGSDIGLELPWGEYPLSQNAEFKTNGKVKSIKYRRQKNFFDRPSRRRHIFFLFKSNTWQSHRMSAEFWNCPAGPCPKLGVKGTFFMAPQADQ